MGSGRRDVVIYERGYEKILKHSLCVLSKPYQLLPLKLTLQRIYNRQSLGRTETLILVLLVLIKAISSIVFF